ncbi:hypothetical protein E2C01_058085 [Portunus trituberculatus]|uniref:Uncharacterized protein n=1 Tax=Portunus trituberculatus TaxID=210409 RepID=A0A5B7H3R7_PORTR|nr:hypothetical protein [Portunus trituberculatus]
MPLFHKARSWTPSMWAFHGNVWAKGYLISQSPPVRKPLPRVRKPNIHSNRGQESNPCAWRSHGPQSTHGSTVPRRVFNDLLQSCSLMSNANDASFSHSYGKNEGAKVINAINRQLGEIVTWGRRKQVVCCIKDPSPCHLTFM